MRMLVTVKAAALLLLAGTALPAQTVQPLRAGGMEIYYGIIPAKIVLDRPDAELDRRAHGGVPAWGEQYHVIIALFEQTSGNRVLDAQVKATVFDAREPNKRLPGPQKQLEPMQVAGGMSYGNYFNMPAPGPYRIELEIQRQGTAEIVKAALEYRHALAPAKPLRSGA